MLGEKIFKGLLYGAGIAIIIMIILVFGTLLFGSWESIQEFGLDFFFSTKWNDPGDFEYEEYNLSSELVEKAITTKGQSLDNVLEKEKFKVEYVTY